MQALNDRDQFAPPRPPGRLRAISLAVLAHVVLIGALTWGVNWKTSADQPAVEAELWSAVPQQAAPRAVAPPPPPVPAPAPAPAPQPAPAPPPPRQAEPDTREADIAIEREKKRLQEEKKRRELQLEREKEQREKRERERKEEERRERLEQEKKERLLAQQQKEKEKEKAEREKAVKVEQEKARKLAEEKRQAQAEAKRAEEFRQEQMRRIAGLAGATGGETAQGNAQRSSGPSGSYGGKVAAKVRPNIVYPDTVTGNPRAEVEVRAAPDGTIVGARITQSSGNKAWDDAVVRALHKTETLPRDVDGRVPSSLVIGFRPRD